MDNLKKLRCSRRGHKSHLAKLLSNTDEIVEKLATGTLSDTDAASLEDYRKQLKHKAGVFADIDQKIIDYLDDEAELEAMVLDSEDLQTALSQKVSLVTHHLAAPRSQVTPQTSATNRDTDAPPVTKPQTSATPTSPSVSDDRMPPPTQSHHVTADAPPLETIHESSVGQPVISQYVARLPKLDVPSFAGDPLKWQSFWDCFEAAIHLNPHLSEVQKLSYLRAQLNGEATMVIAGLPLTNANYQHSVSLLKERYGQPHKLISAHVQALLELPKPINKLTSLQLFHDTVEGHIRCLQSLGKSPDALETLLVPIMLGTSLLSMTANCSTDEQDLQKFWTVEDAGVAADNPDKKFLEHYSESHITRQTDGSYSAMFPWKDNHLPLPDNYQICQGRTRSLVHRLAQSPEMLQTYDNILKDQLNRGFIERVTSDKTTATHYIPHHPVKKDSTTTPIRIVYDCSCRVSANQPSLNDCLLTGPPFLNDLVSIILRFRSHQYGISTDIEKAFLHIILHKKDRNFTRFLWLSDPTNPNSKFDTYRFRTVLFGSVSSPFMLFATLNYHLQQYNNPTSHDIQCNLYVDNVVTGSDSESQALQFYQQSRSMLSEAKFNLRAWASNSQMLMKAAQQDGTADENTLTNVLGIQWDVAKDQLSLPLKGLRPTSSLFTTKREILQDSSKLFDPLGMVSPISVRAKLLKQRLWQQHVTWDEPLDKHLLADWTAILTDICRCPDISVKRQYFDINFMKHGNNMKLHAFADASTKAYGAVIFLCYSDHTTFVIAKGRVAPLKQITLPKLELMAAVIAARLTRFVIDSLPLDVTPHLWTDSQIVLFWLQSTKPLPQFINHRVREITQLIPNAIWRHCPTVDNPADLLTRGLSFDQFNTSSLWWHGPEWLTDQDKWPLWNPQSVSQLHVAAATADEFVPQPPTTDHNIGLHQVMTPENYSSLNRLLAVTAYIQRFFDNLRLSDGARKVTPLSPAELSTAKQRWIKHCQEQAFSSEISALKSTGQIRQTNKSTCLVRQLRLFLDNDGFLRCGGRIHNAPISDIAKFPYLLPQKNGFTKLLIYSLHNKTFHGGVNSTLTALRQEYWVPSGRQYIKGLLRLCTTCKRHHGKPYPAPEPAPLPKDRLRDTTPFTITGVDFTGALYVQDNTGESKVYICLFTCATTRAIHLEVVTDLSVETFMLAFRRFVSRKSLPHIMMSDNASTYLSAAEELRDMLNSKELEASLGRCSVTWKFIPKKAPWYGGYWERLIGLTKAALKKVLGRAHISLTMLQTLVVEVEATLNDRPLTYISDDPRDPQPLTPSDLLYGRRITTLPYRTVTEEDIHDPDYGNPQSRICKSAKKLALLLRHFQARWKHEYLTSLREFHKSQGNKCQKVRVGDIVQIHNEGPRINWRLAVVEELITGKDGLVRAANIRTSTGRTNRPIIKLYPLEVASSGAFVNDDLKNTDDNLTPKQGRQSQRKAAQRAKCKMTEWIQTICAPPEDVENSNDSN